MNLLCQELALRVCFSSSRASLSFIPGYVVLARVLHCAPRKLLFVEDGHLPLRKPWSPLFLQAIQSDPVCSLALKDRYLPLCCLTTVFNRTQHTAVQWTEKLNRCHPFHKSIWRNRIQINIGFLSVSILYLDGGFGLRQINCSKIYNYVILTMVWFNKKVRKKM